MYTFLDAADKHSWYNCHMDQNHEEEFLLHIATGLDPVTAIVATGDGEEKPQKLGCLAVVFIAASVVWLITYSLRL